MLGLKRNIILNNGGYLQAIIFTKIQVLLQLLSGDFIFLK